MLNRIYVFLVVINLIEALCKICNDSETDSLCSDEEDQVKHPYKQFRITVVAFMFQPLYCFKYLPNNENQSD